MHDKGGSDIDCQPRMIEYILKGSSWNFEKDTSRPKSNCLAGLFLVSLVVHLWVSFL